MIFKNVVENDMNRILINFIFAMILVFASSFFPENLEMSKRELQIKKVHMTNFKWLTDELYILYDYRSKQYGVDIGLALSLIRAESNGRNIRSYRQNKNGTHDWGRFQINEVHVDYKNPHRLLIDITNSDYGFRELSLAFKKANGNLKETIRMYNQGRNGNRKNYTGWAYVNRVVSHYRRNYRRI